MHAIERINVIHAQPGSCERNIDMKTLGLLFSVAVIVGAQQANSNKSSGAPRSPASTTAPAKPQAFGLDDIISLVAAGFSDDIIATRLRKESKAFDLNTDDMIRLKKANVSDNIVKLMLDPKAEAKLMGAAPSTTPVPNLPSVAVPDTAKGQTVK